MAGVNIMLRIFLLHLLQEFPILLGANVIGGLACHITMRMTVYREINAKLKVEN